MYQSTGGMPPLMTHLMKESPRAFSNILKDTSDSFLNTSSTDFILETLKTLKTHDHDAHDELLSCIKDSASRNLFHVYGRDQTSEKLFMHLWIHLTPTERSRQILSQDESNKNPFTILASFKNENCHLFWKDFEELLDDNVYLGIGQLFKQGTKATDTILHVCGKHDNDKLLSKICQSKQVEKFVKATMTSTYTPLITINNEKVFESMLRKYNWSEFQDCQKMLFHHICRKDFNTSFHLVKKSMTFEPFLDLLLYMGIFI